MKDFENFKDKIALDISSKSAHILNALAALETRLDKLQVQGGVAPRSTTQKASSNVSDEVGVFKQRIEELETRIKASQAKLSTSANAQNKPSSTIDDEEQQKKVSNIGKSDGSSQGAGSSLVKGVGDKGDITKGVLGDTPTGHSHHDEKSDTVKGVHAGSSKQGHCMTFTSRSIPGIGVAVVIVVIVFAITGFISYSENFKDLADPTDIDAVDCRTDWQTCLLYPTQEHLARNEADFLMPTLMFTSLAPVIVAAPSLFSW